MTASSRERRVVAAETSGRRRRRRCWWTVAESRLDAQQRTTQKTMTRWLDVCTRESSTHAAHASLMTSSLLVVRLWTV